MAVINGLQVRGGQVYEPALGVPTQAIAAPDGKSIALVRAAVLYGPNGEPVAGRPGASQPSQAVLIGGSDGSNLQALSVIPGATGVLATPYSGTKNLALTASAEVKATPGVIGTLVNTGTTTSPTITVYDNTAAAGTVVWSGTLAAGQVLSLGMPCGVGIYVGLSAAGTITLSYA